MLVLLVPQETSPTATDNVKYALWARSQDWEPRHAHLALAVSPPPRTAWEVPRPALLARMEASPPQKEESVCPVQKVRWPCVERVPVLLAVLEVKITPPKLSVSLVRRVRSLRLWVGAANCVLLAPSLRKPEPRNVRCVDVVVKLSSIEPTVLSALPENTRHAKDNAKPAIPWAFPINLAPANANPVAQAHIQTT